LTWSLPCLTKTLSSGPTMFHRHYRRDRLPFRYLFARPMIRVVSKVRWLLTRSLRISHNASVSSNNVSESECWFCLDLNSFTAFSIFLLVIPQLFSLFPSLFLY
jgi:hypothetical protein